MKRIIDLKTWERCESFSFFHDFVNPYISVTCRMDCRKAKAAASCEGTSFFLYYLHAIVRAVNEIPEMRYRIDAEGNIVEYDHIDVLTPIKPKEGKGFVTMRFPYKENRLTFCRHAAGLINEMPSTSAFGAESSCEEFDVVIVSVIPDLPFTAMTCTQRRSGGNDYPLINVGMMDADFLMPVALSVHHGFMDGEHIAVFYKKVQAYLNGD